MLLLYYYALWGIHGLYVGYSGSIHGVFICIGYVSGMYRECVETYGVQKRFSEMVLTTELHGTARKQEDYHLLFATLKKSYKSYSTRDIYFAVLRNKLPPLLRR